MVLHRKRKMHGFGCKNCKNHLFRPRYKETNEKDCSDYCKLDNTSILSSGGACQYQEKISRCGD